MFTSCINWVKNSFHRHTWVWQRTYFGLSWFAGTEGWVYGQVCKSCGAKGPEPDTRRCGSKIDDADTAWIPKF